MEEGRWTGEGEENGREREKKWKKKETGRDEKGRRSGSKEQGWRVKGKGRRVEEEKTRKGSETRKGKDGWWK